MESGWFLIVSMGALVILGASALQGWTNGVGWIDARTISAARLGAVIAHDAGVSGSSVSAPIVWGAGTTGVAAVGGAGQDPAGVSFEDEAAVAATITDLLEGSAVVTSAPLGHCPGRARRADI